MPVPNVQGSKNTRLVHYHTAVMADASTTKQIIFAPAQGLKRRIIKGIKAEDEALKQSYIYLIRTREFKLMNRPIYKVGRTSQEPDTRIRRFDKYTKGSEIYVVEQCSHRLIVPIERDILKEFRETWTCGPDGSEDFEIPTREELMKARQIIHDVIMKYERYDLLGMEYHHESHTMAGGATGDATSATEIGSESVEDV